MNMKWMSNLSVRRSAPRLLNSITASFTEALWLALSRLPSLERLSNAQFTGIKRLTRRLVDRRLIESQRPQRAAQFSFRGGFKGFQVDLAGLVVRRMQAFLHKANNLDLITRLLPEAIAGTVVELVPSTAPERPGTYRLLRDGLPFERD